MFFNINFYSLKLKLFKYNINIKLKKVFKSIKDKKIINIYNENTNKNTIINIVIILPPQLLLTPKSVT